MLRSANLMASPQFRAATPWQRRVRKVRAYGRAWLGLTPFTVDAQGARFVVGMTDHIDRYLAFYGMWEQTQLEKLAEVSRGRKIDIFLDVGANAGFYSVMFATKRLADRVIAFEPDPGNYARLTANLAANDLADRVEAVALAIGDEDSEVMLYEGSKANRGESTIVVPEQTPQEVTFQIRQARLDDLYEIADKNIIMKMDVEGYEFQALAGM